LRSPLYSLSFFPPSLSRWLSVGYPIPPPMTTFPFLSSPTLRSSFFLVDAIGASGHLFLELLCSSLFFLFAECQGKASPFDTGFVRTFPSQGSETSSTGVSPFVFSNVSLCPSAFTERLSFDDPGFFFFFFFFISPSHYVAYRHCSIGAPRTFSAVFQISSNVPKRRRSFPAANLRHPLIVEESSRSSFFLPVLLLQLLFRTQRASSL